jgi:hypothetical protein
MLSMVRVTSVRKHAAAFASCVLSNAAAAMIATPSARNLVGVFMMRG